MNAWQAVGGLGKDACQQQWPPLFDGSNIYCLRSCGRAGQNRQRGLHFSTRLNRLAMNY